MSPPPFDGFRSSETLHCVTGAMRHIYEFHGHSLSEDMLLGLGSGLGFIYWHMKGMAPILGGRGNVGRPGEDGLEVTAGRRTGVVVADHRTSSRRKADRVLLEMLEAGEPVMIYADMGFLPYFDFPEEFHFGAHAIVVCGYDPSTETVLIADRDRPLHPVSWAALAQARGSTFKPFPPKNRWFTFDFSGKRQPTADEIRTSIREVCNNMLRGPITNLGVRGIRKAAKQVLAWPKRMDAEELRRACFNAFIFIDATGGTGGGIFRYMYARFLAEAAAITGDARLAETGEELRGVGDLWQETAATFKRAASLPEPARALPETTDPLLTIAEREQRIWSALDGIVGTGP